MVAQLEHIADINLCFVLDSWWRLLSCVCTKKVVKLENKWLGVVLPQCRLVLRGVLNKTQSLKDLQPKGCSWSLGL